MTTTPKEQTALAEALHSTADLSHRTRFPRPGDDDARGACLCVRDAAEVDAELSERGYTIVASDRLTALVAVKGAARAVALIVNEPPPDGPVTERMARIYLDWETRHRAAVADLTAALARSEAAEKGARG